MAASWTVADDRLACWRASFDDVFALVAGLSRRRTDIGGPKCSGDTLKGHALLDREPYAPASWIEDSTEVTTKPQLAQQVLEQLLDTGSDLESSPLRTPQGDQRHPPLTPVMPTS